MIQVVQESARRRVCLVRPQAITSIHATDGNDAVAPLGLAYLAASLKAAGHHVQGVDTVGEAVTQYSVLPDTPRCLLHGLQNDAAVALIDPETEVVGVSCMFSTEWMVARALIESIRAAFPDVLIVVGGEHLTACPDYTLRSCPAIDVGVIGEGEVTLMDILDAYSAGRGFDTVDGIVFRDGEEIVHTSPRERIRDVDAIPEPDWDSFPVRNYIDAAMTHGANLGRSMPILASRGCPYECTFCSSPFMWTTRWIARDPDAVIAEMKKYMRDYDVTNFDFEDLTAIVNKKWIKTFCEKLKQEDLGITWQLPSGTRSEAIDYEVCQLLHDSGCKIITYAPESGSPEELKRIKKKVKLDRMVESMKGARKAGMDIKCHFICGLPGGSWADVRKTLAFFVKLARIGVNDISYFGYSPYPGAALFHDLQEAGKVSLDDAYFKQMYVSTDVGNTKSYVDYLTPRTLRAVILLGYMTFYGSNCLFHPVRSAKLFWKVLRRDTSTKLTMALAQKRHKHTIAKRIKEASSGSATVPTFTAPAQVEHREKAPVRTS